MKSRDDLLTAERAAQPPPITASLAFHAQQAAEKILKAHLAWQDRPPARTHDLRDLVQQCGPFDADFFQLRSVADVLTPYAVAGRHPGDRSAPSEDEAKQLLDAGGIVAFVLDRLPPEARP